MDVNQSIELIERILYFDEFRILIIDWDVFLTMKFTITTRYTSWYNVLLSLTDDIMCDIVPRILSLYLGKLY